MDVYLDEHPGIHIAGVCRPQRACLRLQSITCSSRTTVPYVTEEDMQRSMDLFAEGCADFGLTISTARTVVMQQPLPSAEYNASRIDVNGAQLKNVETFAYLGRTLSRNMRIDDEVAQWISKARQAFGRLQASLWNRYGIHLNTKLKMYKAIVLTILLYGAETWRE
ncbi:unnamed protein product [Schistocephalus solidus]|uniref:Reverse transcriptase domain-containing protein n=1 Tax=Schistocephalus solidus TaxID=70667 RepID=A0A183T495_SCHSO|nr:unnamed protein product [Schistocephalus solidus]